MSADINILKDKVKVLCGQHKERYDKVRRLFIEERAYALKDNRNVEYEIKKEISEYFGISYSSVSFTGSAQLGFSVHKDKLFLQGESDLDVACIDIGLYQECWIDIVDSTKAFTDFTNFSFPQRDKIDQLKDAILRRGVIRIQLLPKSKLSLRLKDFESRLSRRYIEYFNGISVAIYMNEYAFCWKQDSSLATLVKG